MMILATIALAGVLGAGTHPGIAHEGTAQARTAPAPASTAQAGAETRYSWVGSYYAARTRGLTAILPQAQPKLTSPAAGHSLAEVAVQSAGQKQIVEVGWTVDRAEGDLKPHLFVYAWVNGKGLGYDGRGYVQTGRTWAPGDHVKPGVSAQYTIGHDDGRWWISYQGQRMGYYPDRLWHGRFKHGVVSQAFGEVASNGRAGTEMINGRTDRKISSFHLLDARTPAATFYAPKSHVSYRMGSHGRTWFYLGGR